MNKRELNKWCDVRDKQHSRTGIDVLDRMGAELDAAAQRIDAQEPSAPPPRRRGFTPRRVAFAAVAALLLVVVLVRSGDNSLSTQDAIAAIQKSSIGQVLPADDQFVYTRSKQVDLGQPLALKQPGDDTPAKSLLVQVTREQSSWLSVNKSGRLVTIYEGPLFSSPAQEAELKALAKKRELSLESFLTPSSRVDRLSPSNYRIAGQPLTRAEVLAFPRDPATILQKVRSSWGADSDVVTWNLLTQAFIGASPPLPAALRNGFIGAIGLIPGVRTLGLTRDSKGREAYALQFDKGGIERTVYFDKDNAALLFAEQRVVTRQLGSNKDVPVGTVLTQYTLLEQRVVDRVGQTE